MLIEWIAFAVLVTMLVCVAALAVERVVAIWRGSQRFVWLAALIVASVSPAVLAVRPGSVNGEGAGVRVDPSTWSATLASIPLAYGGRETPMLWRARDAASTLDPYARSMWIGASLLLLGLFTRAAIGLRRHRARWREISLGGATVLLSPNAGPAVIGAFRPAIVVPQWALSLDARARDLMLRHEAEHIAARDPHLLLLGALALIVFPWNVGLWIIARRLRLAIEVDCDRRVLRTSSQAREYGMLLLAVGARRSAALPFVASLAARRPLLERRINAMTAPRPRAPRLVTVALLIVALGATTAATVAPMPSPLLARAPRSSSPKNWSHIVSAERPVSGTLPSLREPLRRPKAGNRVATRQKRVQRSELPTDFIRALIAEHHPSVIDGDSTVNLVMIVVDANDNYVTSRTGRSPQTVQGTRATAAAVDSLAMTVTAPVARTFAIDGRNYMPLVTGQSPTLDDLVEINTIKSVEVMKYGPGVIRPSRIGVVLIALK